MIDRLLAILEQFVDYLKFWEIIYSYEMGVVFRWGKVNRIISPGFHFKYPFAETVQKDIVVTQTLTIPSQTLITKDLKEITIKSVVKYNIIAIDLFLIKVYDRVDAISDTTMVINKELITTTDSDQIHKIDNEITKKLRTQVKKWGIEIESVSLTDVTKTRSIRLFNENVING